MFINERLFYNKFKYRIRFNLKRGSSLLRACNKFIDSTALLKEVERIRTFWQERQSKTNYNFISTSEWNLDSNEKEELITLYDYRTDFLKQPKKQVRVETPLVDFYTCDKDYVKKAEDTGLYPEICKAFPDDPNVIAVKKLPYKNFELKCITRYHLIDRQIADSLLHYEDAGEIKFPWTWETRRVLIGRNHVPLPEYIYALNNDSLTFVNLIAGDIISTVYSYKIV